MSRRRALEGACLALVVALGSWYWGWWVIPAIAAVWQLIRPKEPAWLPAIATGVAWGALLLLPIGSLGRLDGRLSRMLFLPPMGATAVTLAFAALLAWSAARVARSFRG